MTMLMGAPLLTAQPEASSRGPRLRRRSLNQARSMDGPEMQAKRISRATGHHQPREKTELAM